MVLYVSHAVSKECEVKMAENNKEVWFATTLWIKNLNYIMFLLSFVKPTVAELKELKLIKRRYFLFYEDHINFMVRIDEKLKNRDEIIENKIKPIIYKNIEGIRDFMNETKSPNPEHPSDFRGEADTYGKDGWKIVQKFFECGSEFALCKTDPTKEKIVPSTGEGFNEEKIVHCFLNQTRVNPEQEFYFYLKRLIEVSRSAGYEISEIKLRHLT